MRDARFAARLAEVRERHLSTLEASLLAQRDLALSSSDVVLLEGGLETGTPIGPDDVRTDRPINLGSAVANTIGVATGLSLRGKMPFVNVPSRLVFFRACEQLRTDVCYHQANVKIVGTVTDDTPWALFGERAWAFGDLSVARSLPHMTIVAPADAASAFEATYAAAMHEGPVYLRVARRAAPVVYPTGATLRIGKGVVLREGRDVTIVSAGSGVVSECLSAADLLKRHNLSVRVIDMHTVKPIDCDLLVRAARETGLVITVEEHEPSGGLAGAVAEVLGEAWPVPVHALGVSDGRVVTVTSTTGSPSATPVVDTIATFVRDTFAARGKSDR